MQKRVLAAIALGRMHVGPRECLALSGASIDSHIGRGAPSSPDTPSSHCCDSSVG